MKNKNLSWELSVVSEIVDLCRERVYTQDQPLSSNRCIHTKLDRARTIAKMCSGFADVSIEGKQLNVLINKDGNEVGVWTLVVKPIEFRSH